MTDLAIVIAPLAPADLPSLDRLDERAFGPGRFARSAYRLREGVMPAYDQSFVARVSTLMVGANRMTPIVCGQRRAMLLGPLTVEPAFRSRGIGGQLVRASLHAARAAGQSLVLLVGDAPYYGKFGFTAVPPGRLTFPGPVDPRRLLVCELSPGAFEGAGGAVSRAL